MTGVTVASMVMGVQMTGVTVVMFMGISGHRFYSTRRIPGDAALSRAY
jgi:hypothetical protein